MKYTIEHQGVPVGTVELKAQSEVAAADVEPLAGYATIEPVVRAATTALRNLGFRGAVAHVASNASESTVLRDAATLGRQLELRDGRGAAVAVDFIDITDWSEREREIVAFVTFRDASAHVSTPGRPAAQQGHDSIRPDV